MFQVLYWLVCSDLFLFSFAMLSVRPSSHATVDPDEVRRFRLLASKWWEEQGEFAALHAMNDLRVPFIRWVCPLWTLQYSVWVQYCMSLEKQGSDWQRCRAIGVAGQVMHIKADSATHPNTISACSIATVPALHTCIFWGLRLFWFIRSVVEAPQSPILPGIQRSPPPSLVVIATMMRACSDSMTDPPAVYVWVWLILYGCALRVWLNEMQHRLLLLSFLDSSSQTFRHQFWIWNDWTCCSAINKDSVKTNNTLRGNSKIEFLK